LPDQGIAVTTFSLFARGFLARDARTRAQPTTSIRNSTATEIDREIARRVSEVAARRA